MSDSLSPHELQHARPPCPSPTPGVHSDSRPSSQWCHPAISSSVVPFSFCPQPLPASKSFPMSQLFEWGGQSTGVSALASFLQFKFNIITDMSGHKVSTLQFVFYFFHLFIFLLAFVLSVQSLSRVWLFATPWIAARQASLSITISRSSLRLMSIESVMPSSHLILCRPLLLPPSIW